MMMELMANYGCTLSYFAIAGFEKFQKGLSVMRMSVKRAAAMLGVQSDDIAELVLEESQPYCDTYRAKMARTIRGFCRRGQNVLFPVEKRSTSMDS